MKKNTFLTAIFPSALIFLITVFCFSRFRFLTSLDLKGIFIVSLVLLFPMMFLIQGVLCAINELNVFITLGLSTLTFILIALIYLNSSATFYIFLYLISWFLGYGIYTFVKKVKSLK